MGISDSFNKHLLELWLDFQTYVRNCPIKVIRYGEENESEEKGGAGPVRWWTGSNGTGSQAESISCDSETVYWLNMKNLEGQLLLGLVKRVHCKCTIPSATPEIIAGHQDPSSPAACFSLQAWPLEVLCLPHPCYPGIVPRKLHFLSYLHDLALAVPCAWKPLLHSSLHFLHLENAYSTFRTQVRLVTVSSLVTTNNNHWESLQIFGINDSID